MNYEDRVTKAAIEAAIEGKCEVVFGSYLGNDSASQAIELGFRPKAVLMAGGNGVFSSGNAIYGGFVVDGAVNAGVLIQITDTGFTVHKVGSYWGTIDNYHMYAAFR